MGKMVLATLAALAWLSVPPSVSAQARTEQRADSPSPRYSIPCSEMPGGNQLRLVCPTPAFLPVADEDDDDSGEQPIPIVLKLPEGTALRIAIDARTRISHVGETVKGYVVETVYAFDEPVIPEGSVVTGRVTQIAPVPKLRLAQEYANGNFSPFHQYQVTFDHLRLPDGREIEIATTVAPGAAEVVHLVSKPPKDNDAEKEHKNGAARAMDATKQQVKAGVQEANDSAHQAADQIRAPGKMHRLKQFLLEQSPYRRQYIEVGTRFSASLTQGLDFGSDSHSQEQLSALGDLPQADTVLHARLVLELSSATATRGTPVVAELTEPVYSSDHHLLMPSGCRLIGQVVEARPARRLHRNGELRVIFEHIEMPGGGLQEVQGTLEGIEVSRAAHMKLDEEGGARATDSKMRYLSTGVALLLAAAAAHPDVDRGGMQDPAGDPAVRAGAGASGFGLAGTVIGLAAKSNAVSIAFSAYGATASIYTNFLSRGREVVLPKDAPVEIGLGTRHPRAH
ncbi:MAG: TrbI/VirB10 family protein [Candidatus Acidiferrum sp.]